MSAISKQETCQQKLQTTEFPNGGSTNLIPPDDTAIGDGDGEGDAARRGDGHGEEKGELWADEKWFRAERRSGLAEQDRASVAAAAAATGFNIFTLGSPFWLATPFE